MLKHLFARYVQGPMGRGSKFLRITAKLYSHHCGQKQNAYRACPQELLLLLLLLLYTRGSFVISHR